MNKDLSPMKSCSRFEKCSVPVCPLDPDMDRRTRLPGEPKCTMAKTIRMRLAEGSDLPRKGMTKKEFAPYKDWRGLDEAASIRRKAHLKQHPPFARGSHRGVTCGDFGVEESESLENCPCNKQKGAQNGQI